MSLLFSLLGAVYLGNELSQQSGADADREKKWKTVRECYSLCLLFTLWVSCRAYANINMSSISLSFYLFPSRPGLLKAGDPGLPWLADSWPSTSLPANSGLGASKDLTNFGRGGKISRGYNTVKERAWKRRSLLQSPQESEKVTGSGPQAHHHYIFLNSCMKIMNILASIESLSSGNDKRSHTHTLLKILFQFSCPSCVTTISSMCA